MWLHDHFLRSMGTLCRYLVVIGGCVHLQAAFLFVHMNAIFIWNASSDSSVAFQSTFWRVGVLMVCYSLGAYLRF